MFECTEVSFVDKIIFGRMKVEMRYEHEHEFQNGDQLLAAINEYITYYNTTRIVSKFKMSAIDNRNSVINNIL